LESPPESAPEAPPELEPAPPREPILTLPGALTAYVLLLAVFHLRVLLPVDLENWTIDVFGFIPKRYDSTLLAIDFRCCTPISAISGSMCCGCCRSAARWRGALAQSGSSCSWR